MNETFHDRDFAAMRECATRLKPGRVIFSTLTGEPSEALRERIRTLEADLRAQKTEVRWLTLPETIHEPSSFF